MTEEATQNPPSKPEETASEFLKALYGDPLSPETFRIGRYLVITSVILMAVILFNVRLQGTSLIPIDFGSRFDVLPMLLSLAVLLLLLSFSLRSVTDVLHDQEAGVLVTRYLENARVKAAQKAARETDDEISETQRQDRYDGYEPEPDPWWESYYDISKAAEAAVLKAEARIGVRRLPRELRRARKILEIGVPILLALIALALSRGSLSAFSVAMISALTPGR